MIRRVRGGGMKAASGMPVMILHTRGATTGQDRAVALGYLEDRPDAWLIIASTGGATWNPAWLHNLAKDPDATIEFTGGRRVEVHAESLEGDELAAAWKRIDVDAPQYAAYRTKTDREIPVVRLRERATA